MLLAWTDELDDERAITLWGALGAVDDEAAREAALLRWIDWAGVTVPLDVKLRALAEAVAQLLRELEATAQSPERIYVYQNADLPPLARALQGWMRAREAQPGVVLGALQALTLIRESMRAWTDRMRLRPPDAAPPRDLPPALDRPADVSATADSDRDGVCDLTEVMRRTDPTRVDTDGDGLIDSFELRIGTDPLSGRSPAASDRVLFREGSTSFATVEHLFEYRGTGDVVSATSLDRTAGVDGARASDLWDFAVEATGASPQAFVRAMSGPRYVGVLGMVVLRWRLTATPRATPAAGVRATPTPSGPSRSSTARRGGGSRSPSSSTRSRP